MNLYEFTIYVDVCHLNDVYRDKDEFYLMIDYSWIFLFQLWMSRWEIWSYLWRGVFCMHHWKAQLCWRFVIFDFKIYFNYLKSFTNFNQPLLNSGSECTVMKDGNYECLCPLGKTGKFCRDSISISDPLFTGKHSFMSLNLDTHIRFNTEVSIFFWLLESPEI